MYVNLVGILCAVPDLYINEPGLSCASRLFISSYINGSPKLGSPLDDNDQDKVESAIRKTSCGLAYHARQSHAK